MATFADLSNDWPLWHALPLGLAAAAIGLVLTPGDALRAHAAHRRGPSLRALAGVVIALSAGWMYDGWGLEPLQALLASLVAGGAGALALLLTRSTRQRRLLIVGSGRAADALCSEIAGRGHAKVVGRIDERVVVHVLGGTGDLEHLVHEHRVDGVVFTRTGAGDVALTELAERCRELGLVVGGSTAMLVSGRRQGRMAAAVSRALDCVLVTILLVLTAPIWIAIAIAIVVDEPGPVVYRARRVGRRGREFDMYKFRKMRRDAAGPRLTVAGDDRFTRVGRFLARTKLDELPQLLNVLRGEMALVGPRPEDPSFVAAFPAEFAAITQVRPGITGLSQIQYRDESSLLVGDDYETLYREFLLPEKIALDLFYARHRSIALDLRALVWTVVAIAAGATVQRDEITASVSFARLDRSAGAEALRLGPPTQPDVLRDVV